MNNFDFITGNIRYSHSSTSTFDNCRYAFKLHYIDALRGKGNFYGEYGTLVHECLEKFFNGELGAFELSQYYTSTTTISYSSIGKEKLSKKYFP